ncbi:hypothetical protein A0H81_12799 [Grifola frondosa]|uniref:DUF6533 domain-containing protein n=1 Tax=Grifola frondosa TaxID=5627 RepID=A0A1C7LTM2_GRIFR|nr:hypothetical protein A0H81_12799 [Grifola frondosa]
MSESASTIARANGLHEYMASVAFALLYYDFVLTIPMEVERYWTGGLSWASSLYFVNRYLSVLGTIPVIVEYFMDVSETRYVYSSLLRGGSDLQQIRGRCRQLQFYHQIIAALTQFVVPFFPVLRTYALYNCNRKVLYALICMYCLGVGIVIWAIVNVRTNHVVSITDITTTTRCYLTLSTKQKRYLAIAWSPGLVLDGIVFVLMLIQARRTDRNGSGSVFKVLFRDGEGTIYFGLIQFCYLANVLSYALPMTKPAYTTLANAYALSSRGCNFARAKTDVNSISSTMTARFMLNIRDPELIPHRWQPDSTSSVGVQRDTFV